MGALEEVFASMGKPLNIYSDEEGVMNSDTFFLTFINERKFKHTQPSTHAHTAERFIQPYLGGGFLQPLEFATTLGWFIPDHR